MASELFELSMLGGSIERRYRRLRPDVERLPWGSLARAKLPDALREEARVVWTRTTFHEHRTAAACAATMEALVAARAPLDLVAVGSRFVLDELTHVELCARVLGELGGAVTLTHDPGALYPPPGDGLSPLLRAADLVIRVFCVGEAFSVPMAQVAAARERQPLVEAVLRRIARDEAAHGRFGWTFFDWAGELLTASDRAYLSRLATTAFASLERSWKSIAPTRGETLGWIPTDEFRRRARRALDEDVRQPLRARGLLVD